MTAATVARGTAARAPRAAWKLAATGRRPAVELGDVGAGGEDPLAAPEHHRPRWVRREVPGHLGQLGRAPRPTGRWPWAGRGAPGPPRPPGAPRSRRRRRPPANRTRLAPLSAGPGPGPRCRRAAGPPPRRGRAGPPPTPARPRRSPRPSRSARSAGPDGRTGPAAARARGGRPAAGPAGRRPVGGPGGAATAPHNSSIPLRSAALVSTTGGRQSAGADRSSICSRSRRASRAPGRSALLTTSRSATSSSPALLACIESPHPGVTTTTVVSAAEATSTSIWPTPTVSRSTRGSPTAPSTRTASGTASVRPPRWPRVAMDRMKTVGSVAWSCMRTRSPRMAPPVNGEEGSTARTATWSTGSDGASARAGGACGSASGPPGWPSTAGQPARAAVMSRSVSVDLPAPGAPVSPTV